MERDSNTCDPERQRDIPAAMSEGVNLLANLNTENIVEKTTPGLLTGGGFFIPSPFGTLMGGKQKNST